MLATIDAIGDNLVLLHGWRRRIVAFCAGALSALALPPLFWAPVLFLTLPTLVLLLDAADADPPSHKRVWHPARLMRGAFSVGWWFGFGYFLAGLYWIAEALTVNASAHAWLIPFALIFIPGGLALFIAIPCAIAGRFWGLGFSRVGLLASLLTIGEMARGVLFTGFPWNGFHSALGIHDSLLQGMSVVGATAASLLVLLVAMSPGGIWPLRLTNNRARLAGLFCFILALAWIGFGVARLVSAEDRFVENAQFRLVQPNIAQVDKWKPELGSQHFNTLLRLTLEGSSPQSLGLLSTTHVVWPESAFPFLLNQRPDALAAIGQALPLGTQLLAGAIRTEPRGQDRVFYNAIYAFNDRGEIADAYDKVRLVPFGEFLPFADLVDRAGLRPIVSAPAGFERGRDPRTLDGSAGLRGLALICYEIIFPGFVRDGVRADTPDYLLNLTNDAWFGSSAGPHQHFFQARLRAVELGLPMVRSANTGISAVADSYGRVTGQLGINTQGVLDARLPAALSGTPYRRFGSTGLWLLLALVLSTSYYHLRVQKIGST